MGDPARKPDFEGLVHEIGAELLHRAVRARPSLFDARGLRGRALARAIENEELRAALFRFVDTLPQLRTNGEVAAHLRAYLGGHALGGAWGRLAASAPLAPAVRASVKRIARNFLVEETPAAIRCTLAGLTRVPAVASFDAVGEAVLTEAEADRYLERNLLLLDCLRHERVAAPNLSIKLSALTPRFDPIDPEGSCRRAMARLEELMPRVQALGATLVVDMEHHDLNALTLEAFRRLLDRFPGRNWTPGIVQQAYLRSAPEELGELIDEARRRERRICIRLVKGAYWDTEMALAAQRGWPEPVLLDKAQTDAQFERMVDLLFYAGERIYPAIASHNVRSVAYAIARARLHNVRAWEVQMLHGMAEPLVHAVAATGVPIRVYVPTGDLLSGIAYLIRRLVENTANTSIVRQTWLENRDPAELLAAPWPRAAAGEEAVSSDGFSNTPVLDFGRLEVREAFAAALARVRAQFGAGYPLRIAGAQRGDPDVHERADPAHPSTILGSVEQASVPQAARAVENAVVAFDKWRAVPTEERVALLRIAADLMEQRRHDLAAWEVFEVGKNWREADADVAEAIDHLRYYAAQALQIGDWKTTRAFPGERNDWRYEPRGVTVTIAPWNFPLAILAGMCSAALAAGNAVIMKPAQPAQIVALRFAMLLEEAGVPAGVCQLVAGNGGTVGEFLVEHPAVAAIAFTGSRDVGFDILRRASAMRPVQRQIKRVVCELGGKNAIIVDGDADLDEAVADSLASAFGYQGQKCSAASRVIAVDEIHDAFVARLAQALDAWSYGPPEDPQYAFGPVITAEAKTHIERWIEIGRAEAKLYYRGRVPAEGFYVAPAIFVDVDASARIAREEIFGPVLSVLRARSFEQALDLALDCDYALTGGVFSRLPKHIELARNRFRVGDLYINRRITGARVGVQPFGGMAHSGTGVQAGGPDYVRQFMWTRVVSENTLRHGYVPPQEG